MSLNLSKSPLWATVVIVGLIAATALIAGYVDRPGTDSEVATAADKCASCPREGTAECCKVTGVCAEAKATGGDGSTCSDGDCPSKAECAAEKTCSSTEKTCSKEASACGSCPKAAAEKTCSSAQAGCSGGGCGGK